METVQIEITKNLSLSIGHNYGFKGNITQFSIDFHRLENGNGSLEKVKFLPIYIEGKNHDKV